MKLSRITLRVNRIHRAGRNGGALLAGVLAGVLACSGSGGPTAIEIGIDRIDVTAPCTVVIEGDTCQIVAQAFAEDGRLIQNPVLRYTSSNPATADVSTTGVMTGRAPGQVTIVVSNTTGSVSDQFNASILPNTGPK